MILDCFNVGMFLYRCPLAPTILLLIAAGIEPTTFPLIDSPPTEAIRASLTLLKDLGKFFLKSNHKKYFFLQIMV